VATAKNPKPTKPAKPSKAGKAASSTVDDFMRATDHPLKAEMQAVRDIILGVDAHIGEAIKWNAPSFATSEHFATFNPRATDCVQIIFHFGAKVKDAAKPVIDDPAGLLEWLGKDRASVKLKDMKTVKSNRAALEAIVRQWITHVE